MDLFTLAAAGGFTLLHSSQCRPKNTTSIIIANLLSIAIGTLVFWACGYAFSIGDGTLDNSNFFLSHKRFFLIDANNGEYAVFASETIILFLVLVLCNAGFICRLRHWIYPILTIFIAGFVYPCVRHWTNHQEGWLRDGIDITRNNGKVNINYVDLYGAGSIHVFSGSVALLGTILLAPRKERKGKRFRSIGGHLTPLILVGGTLAYIGLLGKNGYTNGVSLTNNLLASQASALITYILKRTGACGDKSGTKALINGALVGLVSVSCLAPTYHAYGAFIIGFVAGLAFVSWSTLLQLCHVDDPTDTISVHLGGGLWAMLAGPVFQRDTGILYTGNKEMFEQFGWHLLGGLAIFVWAGLTIFIVLIIFIATGFAKHKSNEAHENGLDAYEHKEAAYPDRDHYTQEEYLEHQGSMDAVLTAKEPKSYGNGNGAYTNDQYRSRAAARNGDSQYKSYEYPESSWQAQAKY